MRIQSGPSFGVDLERRDGVVRVVFRGELDMAVREEAARGLAQAISAGSDVIMVDLQSLSFMGSTGIHCLMDAKAQADAAGTRLAILNGSGAPHRVLTLSGLDQFIELIDDPRQLDE